jgi:hypothetical protein
VETSVPLRNEQIISTVSGGFIPQTAYLRSYLTIPCTCGLSGTPYLKLKREATDGGELQDAAEEWNAYLGMAHQVYSLELDSLTTGRELRLQPIGIRVYEIAGEAPQAFLDVSDDDDPQMQQLSASKNHLEPYARGLSEAVATFERSHQECELRLLRVPALILRLCGSVTKAKPRIHPYPCSRWARLRRIKLCPSTKRWMLCARPHARWRRWTT